MTNSYQFTQDLPNFSTNSPMALEAPQSDWSPYCSFICPLVPWAYTISYWPDDSGCLTLHRTESQSKPTSLGQICFTFSWPSLFFLSRTYHNCKYWLCHYLFNFCLLNETVSVKWTYVPCARLYPLCLTGSLAHKQ